MSVSVTTYHVRQDVISKQLPHPTRPLGQNKIASSQMYEFLTGEFLCKKFWQCQRVLRGNNNKKKDHKKSGFFKYQTKKYAVS